MSWGQACLLGFFFVLHALYCSCASPPACNIERSDVSELLDMTRVDNFPTQPVIYTGLIRQSSLEYLGSREYLLSSFGDTTVTVSSSNTFSQGLFKMTLGEYLASAEKDNTINKNSNESYYFFGNNYKGIWKTLEQAYITPICPLCEKAGAKTLGIGGKSSGVSFHFHSLGFSEVIIGRKRWYLFPPSATPLLNAFFSPNQTAVEVVAELYEEENEKNCEGEGEGDVDQQCGAAGLLTVPAAVRKQLRESLLICDLHPQELLYFPANWMHATTNLENYNVFYSLFLDPQLMTD